MIKRKLKNHTASETGNINIILQKHFVIMSVITEHE